MATIKLRPRSLIVATWVLAAVVAGIALRIEWLDSQAGGVLANPEYRNNDPAEGRVKWRQSSATSEEGWRQSMGPRNDNGTPADRPLTPSEQDDITMMVAKGQAKNSLRYVVSTFGLFQYLLVSLLLVLAISVVANRGKAAAAIPLLVAVAAGFLMFWRGYFTSLGD